MKSRWNEAEASPLENDPLALRAYTSRLLGQEPELVLHGGGNTSVKAEATDFFGDTVETLYVKGSGWDLATIKKPGFAPERLDVLKRLATLDTLSDSDMVEQQRVALLDSKAPNASVEAILHAIIPFRYVDHTHANAVIALMNTEDGEARIRDLYGDRVIVIPYVMPGFALAKLVYQQTLDTDWSRYEGMVLMNHGVFTFSDSARESYESMIALVTEAENALDALNARQPALADGDVEPLELAALRAEISKLRGQSLIARLDRRPEAVGYANLPGAEGFATKGPLTPDHSIFAKRIPAFLGPDPIASVQSYAADYRSYFDRNATPGLSCLDPAPRWAVWPGSGIVSFGTNPKNARVIGDIAYHTSQVVQAGEALGGWKPLDEADIFEVEYWELEQAKLKSGKAVPALQGKVALIALGNAARRSACIERYLGAGAAVISYGTAPEGDSTPAWVGFDCALEDPVALRLELAKAVESFGGIDILIADTGFKNAQLDNVLTTCLPYLEFGWEPALVWIGTPIDQPSAQTTIPEIAIDPTSPGYLSATRNPSQSLDSEGLAVLALNAATAVRR